MKKKKWFTIIELTILLSLMFLSLYIFKQFDSIHGFTIFQSQPNQTTGKDTYIRENLETNYGTSDIIKVGKTAAGLEFRALIEFNISSIPSADTVVSAILQLYLNASSTNNNVTINIYRITSSWNQTTATWNNNTATSLWSTAGGDYSSLIDSQNISNVTGAYNFTLTSLVRGWVNGSYSNNGIILVSLGASSGDYKDIASSEAATNSQSPMLIVDHTSNAAPIIVSLASNTNSTNLKNTGEQITFNISWTDLEGNQAQLYVCNSSSINLSGCSGRTFCNTSLASTNPATCSYTSQVIDNRTTDYWAAVCDSSNCSSANQSQFFINHFPNTTLIQPNGGETINQSQGNYLVKFNVSDYDSDNLTMFLYYGSAQNSTNYTIASLAFSAYCSDPDSNITTTNNCSYSWNTTGIYGTYFMTIITNDTYATSNDSSDSSFNVRSIIDTQAPNITAQWIESNIYSGKHTQIYANISDTNMDTAWVSINASSTNITMSNTTSLTFNATWRAISVGKYQFKVYAQDKVGNVNSSMPWQEFNISKPSAVTQAQNAPASVLPYSVMKVSGQLNATNSLRDVFAYLYAPSDFTFLQNYSQNISIGNFSDNETKTAVWFVSSPITESNYTLNITYTDYYANSWNSSLFYTQVTSSVGGGYLVSVAGYSEVETGQNYYAEANFKQNGVYAAPDSIKISLYDSTGQLTVGPLDITNNPSTGVYNYTRNMSSGSTEGQWETRINATKSSTSYYSNQFWKLVGGPFDVRSITINNNIASSLNISVTTENTGGASKDLILVWNLTREDNNQQLDSGSDTFAVNARSTKVWTVYPSTSYIGQVKITFLGYYSGTEKAGAFKSFTTISNVTTTATTTGGGGGGGGGGGTVETKEKKIDFKLQNFQKEIYLTKNLEKIILLEINNTGEQVLTNISLELDSLDSSYYTLSPLIIQSLNPKEIGLFSIKILVRDFIGEKDFNYLVKTKELAKNESAKLIVLEMKDFFTKEFERLENKIVELKKLITPDFEKEFQVCESIVNKIKADIEKEEFINARDNIKEADECIAKLEKNLATTKEKSLPETTKMPEYWVWLITWVLILLLIAALAVIIYLLYKKLSVLSFLKQEEKTKKPRNLRKEYFEKKLEKIEEELED